MQEEKKSEKACYIVGAGSFEKLDRLPQERDLVIAADGGYAYLKKLGIQPDVLLGDFDSLEYVPEHDHILRHSPIKDDTDMALAAFYAQEKGYRLFYLYGGLGGKRLDHTMANFQLLTGLSRAGMKAYLIGENNIVTAITGERISFAKEAEGMISVFSMTDTSTGIWEKGLKYTLDDAMLKNDKVLGVSNEFIGEESSISVQEGTLLVMWEERNGLPIQREVLKKTTNAESATTKNETQEEAEVLQETESFEQAEAEPSPYGAEAFEKTEVELSVQNVHGEEE